MSLITQAGHTVTNRNVPRSQPSCTHVRVDRLYGDYPCDVCRYHSCFGWLYHCTADVPEVGDYQFLKTLTHPSTTLGQELREAGLSESIVRQAEQGVYTTEQLQLLKQQKAHLVQTIQGTSYNRSQSRRASKSSNKPACCDFKVCHHCRPLFVDRAFMSFGAIFEDEVRPIDMYEILELPIKDVRIAKTLGIRPPLDANISVIAQGSETPEAYTPGSNCTTDGSTDSSSEPNHEDYSWGRTQQESWTDARTDEAWAGSHEGGPYPTVGPFVTVREHHRFFGSEPIKKPTAQFSVPRRLRRISRKITDYSPVRSNKSSSSASLPGTRTTRTSSSAEDGDTTQTDPGCYADMTTAQEFTFTPGQARSRRSSFVKVGDEVEVKGGFALTEEAVRTGTPDLFLSV